MDAPAQSPDPLADEQYRLAVVDLLGALAYGELTAFERLADDASFAPTIADKAALAKMAVAEYNHFALLRARLAEMGVSPEAAMEPFIQALEEFHARTAPADWLEGLVKAYVGDGIAEDFYREVSAYLDDSTRDLVLTVLEDTGHSEFAVDRVRAAIEADPRVGRAAGAVGPPAGRRGAQPGPAGRRRTGRARVAAGGRRRAPRRRPGGGRPDVRPAHREPHRADGQPGAVRLTARPANRLTY